MHSDAQHLRPAFITDTYPDPAATAKKGVPSFRERVLVKVFAAGERHEIGVYPVTEQANGFTDPASREALTWEDVFREEYEAFKRNEAIALQGTPIEKSGAFSSTECATLKALNIITVEQMANADSALVKRLRMVGTEYKERAESFLAKRVDAVDLRAQNEELLATLAEMKRQISVLSSQQTANAVELAMPEGPVVEDTGPLPEEVEVEIKDDTADLPGEYKKLADDHGADVVRSTRATYADQMKDWDDEGVKEFLRNRKQSLSGSKQARLDRAVRIATAEYLNNPDAD